MGSFDGAETCELVGLYILNKLASIIEKEMVGLYRDDGLAAIHNANGKQMDQVRKKLHRCFNEDGLKITVQTNMVETDILDSTLNLKNDTYKPFRKPNDVPQYINTNSNHPPVVKRNLPSMINKRISELSCNEAIFEESKKIYSDALAKSGYHEPLTYNTLNQNTEAHRKKKRNRPRNILWFNPPYNSNVKTNVGKKFFNLLKKHFPPQHHLHKIINRNTVKLSYCCMPNMATIIHSHNKALLQNQQKLHENSQQMCNCRVRSRCPLDGKCMAKNTVYQADVSGERFICNYIGASKPEWKSRHYNHRNTFNDIDKRSNTELSNKIWELKDKNIPFEINWKILQQTHGYSPGKSSCDLCTSEKFHIIKSWNESLLNSRSEIVSKCRHMREFLLQCVK